MRCVAHKLFANNKGSFTWSLLPTVESNQKTQILWPSVDVVSMSITIQKSRSVGTGRPQLASLPKDTDRAKRRSDKAAPLREPTGRVASPFSFPKKTLHWATLFISSLSAPLARTIGDTTIPAKDALEKSVIPVQYERHRSHSAKRDQEPGRTHNAPRQWTCPRPQRQADSAGLQVIVFARKFIEGGVAPQDMPILVVRTDGSGYFFGEVPNERFEHAAALVAGIKNEIIIALDDGLIPKSIPLVLELPAETDAEKKRKTADVVQPRALRADADFDSAPDSFSNDLGTGNCVQSTTPTARSKNSIFIR